MYINQGSSCSLAISVLCYEDQLARASEADSQSLKRGIFRGTEVNFKVLRRVKKFTEKR